ncbi:unnamed protein product, partial [Menidia menidia]
VSEVRTLQELKVAVEPLTDYLATAGCLRNLTSLTDKYQLLKDILMFQVVHRVLGPFERFRDGLKTLGVLQKIQLHPEAFRKYPVANTCINYLRLPLCTHYEAFKEVMDFAIRNTQGFGMAGLIWLCLSLTS